MDESHPQRRSRDRKIAWLSTLFVAFLIASNVQQLPLVPAVARFIGLDQNWHMFTRPPRADYSVTLLVEQDGTLRRLDNEAALSFRWRRYITSVRQAADQSLWECLAVAVRDELAGGSADRVVFAQPLGAGRFSTIASIDLTTGGKPTCKPDT